MSSSSGRKFTGTAIVVLALFGIGGALVDKMRGSGEDSASVDTIPVAPLQSSSSREPLNPDKDVLNSDLTTQKPGFEVINLADDGTGTVAGKAIPGSRIVLDIDGKATKVGEVSEGGNFSLDLEQPLDLGKHILTLKSIGPISKAPVTSLHSIEVNINKDRETVVALLEPGKPRLVLQGVEDGAEIQTAPEEVQSNVKKNAQAPTRKDKTADASKDALDEATKTAEKKADKSVDKPEFRDITFAEMNYTDAGNKTAEVNIAGEAQAGANLRFVLDGKVIGKTTADKKGAWRLKVKQELAPGAHWLVTEQLGDDGERIAHAESPFDIPETSAQKIAQAKDKKTPEPGSKDALEMIKDATKSANKTDDPKSVASDVADKAQKGDGKTDKPDNLWDKFAGIFKVDPDGNKTSNKGDGTAKSGENSRSFAFESLSFKSNDEGGALELTGYAEPGSRIRLFKGSRELGEVVASTDGLWSYTKTGKMRSGRHLFRAAQLLKSGRISTESRMQYDHVEPTRTADLQDAPKKNVTKGKSQTPASNKPPRSMSKETKVADADAGKPASLNRPRPSKSAGTKRQSKRLAAKTTSAPATKSKYKKNKRSKSVRKSAKRKSAARYYLRGKNKARYLAKRKLYPRSRKTPTRVRVRKGTTLWGYSKHYYGKGKLYPYIQRANRRKIRNPNRLLPGQKIYVPRLSKKRLKRQKRLKRRKHR